MEEVWKDVVGYEGYYIVSNLGRLMSCTRILPDGRKIKGRIRKPKENKFGYYLFGLSKLGKTKNKFLHRIVAEAFICKHKEGLEINHKDGDKKNNSVSNLEWVTPKENIKHARFVLKRKMGECNSIPVFCVELGRWFSSKKEAADFVGIKYISNVGNPRRTSGGFHWSRAEAPFDKSIFTYSSNLNGSKPRCVVCKETGNTFPSIRDAARFISVPESTLSVYMKKGRSVCGCHWEYYY